MADMHLGPPGVKQRPHDRVERWLLVHHQGFRPPSQVAQLK